MSNNNIIVFPKAKKFTPPNNMDDIMEMVSATRREHIEFLIDETLAQLFGRCYVEGFDLSDTNCLHSTALLIDAVRAALYKSAGFEHKLHEFAKENYEDDLKTQNQILNITVEDQDILDS